MVAPAWVGGSNPHGRHGQDRCARRVFAPAKFERGGLPTLLFVGFSHLTAPSACPGGLAGAHQPCQSTAGPSRDEHEHGSATRVVALVLRSSVDATLRARASRAAGLPHQNGSGDTKSPLELRLPTRVGGIESPRLPWSAPVCQHRFCAREIVGKCFGLHGHGHD